MLLVLDWQMTRRVFRITVFIIQSVMLLGMLVLHLLIVVPYARLERQIKLRRKERPRVAWGTTPIINLRYGSQAARLYGYKSDTIVYSVSRINKISDFDYVIDECWHPKTKVLKILRGLIGGLVSPYIVFLWGTLKYDIFHFYFDGGFLGRFAVGHKLELPLLRLAGKKTIIVPYGCEARVESVARKYKYSFCMYCTGVNKVCNEEKTRRYLKLFCKYADVILGCSDLVECLPRHDGIWQYPIELSEWPPTPQSRDSGTIRIVHAANHRRLKGTDFLVSAVEKLKAEGYPVDLTIVERMENREAKKIYEQADIIADQFIAGSFALFAIEGMALGKPVLCYLNDAWFPYHPEWTECPIVNTSPEDIREQIIRLMRDQKLRQELGRKGIDYVRKYHSSEAVGAELDKLYRSLWSGRVVKK